MGRKLPTVDILGTRFFVDVQRDELWQAENPKNRISFSLFDQDGNGYTFLYDKIEKAAPTDKSSIAELGDRYEWVTLPALMELDPEGIAIKYDIPLQFLCPELAINRMGEDEEEDIYGDELYE